ncbi:hypothetical protein Tco_0523865 [Tanacetum coccineum]
MSVARVHILPLTDLNTPWVNLFASLLLWAVLHSTNVALTQKHLECYCGKIFVPEEVQPQLQDPYSLCMKDQLEHIHAPYCSILSVPYVPERISCAMDWHKAPELKNERPIITVAKHRIVTLLPTSVVRSFGELSASVEREFVGDASVGDGYRVQRLRPDYGTTGGSATGGKSPSVLNRLLQDSRLMVEQGVPALPTLPFITSYVTTSPLEEGGDRTDSVTGPSLRILLFADVIKDKIARIRALFVSSSSSENTEVYSYLFTGMSGSSYAAGSIRARRL